MRKPNEPVADTSAASKLRRWGPIALQDLFDRLSKSDHTVRRPRTLPQLAASAWALARSWNWSQEPQVRFGRFAGTEKRTQHRQCGCRRFRPTLADFPPAATRASGDWTSSAILIVKEPSLRVAPGFGQWRLCCCCNTER